MRTGWQKKEVNCSFKRETNNLDQGSLMSYVQKNNKTTKTKI